MSVALILSVLREEASDGEDDIEMDEEKANPLVVPLESRQKIAQEATDLWFSKESFAGLEDDEIEDVEIGQAMKAYQKMGGVIVGGCASIVIFFVLPQHPQTLPLLSHLALNLNHIELSMS